MAGSMASISMRPSTSFQLAAAAATVALEIPAGDLGGQVLAGRLDAHAGNADLHQDRLASESLKPTRAVTPPCPLSLALARGRT